MLHTALLFATFLLPQSSPRDLGALLAAEPAKFERVLAAARAHRLQVLLTEPETRADGIVLLRRSAIGEPRQYFYPASSIKLAAAIATMLELQRLRRAHSIELGDDAAWRIAPRFAGDAADPDWLPIDGDLQKMLVVSDNPAFNHCFELLGPRRLNETMWTAGLRSCRIWHRLSESRTLAENRSTRAVTLRGTDRELEIAARDEEDVGVALDNRGLEDLVLGSAYLRDGDKIDAPMSFAHKNAIALRDLQDLLVAVVRPELATGKRGFPELSAAARTKITGWITLARAGVADRGNPVQRGVCRVVPAEHARVLGKSGRAYGFSIENTYVEDRRTGRGFFLAAVLYANPNGVLNDDDYGYAATADPFLADLGEVLARAVFGER